MKHSRVSIHLAVLFSLVPLALLASGCKGEGPAPARYTVRGVVEELPSPEARNTILVEHEAIPEFVHRDGKGRGMDAMVMPFGVAPELSLEGFAKGDKVELELEVRWDRHPAAYVVSMRKLPPDTQLEL